MTCQTCPTCGQSIRAARPARARKATAAPAFLSPAEIAALSRDDLFAYRKRTAFLRYGSTPETDPAALALLADLKTRAATTADGAALYRLKIAARAERFDPARPFRCLAERDAAEAAQAARVAEERAAAAAARAAGPAVAVVGERARFVYYLGGLVYTGIVMSADGAHAEIAPDVPLYGNDPVSVPADRLRGSGADFNSAVAARRSA